MTTEQTGYAGRSRQHQALSLSALLVWLAIFVPFVITVLANGPAGGLLPHGTYHLLYVAIIAGAIYALLQWHSTSTRTIARRLIVVIAVLQGLAAVGHVGEWASTLSDDRYEEAGIGLVKGNESLHTIFANVTVPALALSILLLIATIALVSRGSRDRNHG